MLNQDKIKLKFDRVKQQFGCGYYLVCCGDECPCSLKSENYNSEKMKMLKEQFDKEAIELFG